MSSGTNARLLPREAFDALVTALRQERRVLGPRARDGAIVWSELSAASDLQIGVGDEQSPGRYRLTSREDTRAFAYAVGPSSLKEALFPPR